MKNKRIHAGFTLAEILLTVALLGIVLSVAGAAFMAMRENCTKVTLKAEALTLYSTAEMELSDQMHNASDVTVENGTVSFVSDSLTYTYTNDDDNGIFTMNLQVKHGNDIIFQHESKVKPYTEVNL
jgi:prepilin-type N-terminal cleavage/methylation domain-containing protein